MNSRNMPEVGSWYKDETGASFEVIFVDEADGTVQVQHFDGALESLDLDSWFEMALIQHAPPEDWSGPFDDVTPDDLDEGEAAARHHEALDPLDRLEGMEFDD